MHGERRLAERADCSREPGDGWLWEQLLDIGTIQLLGMKRILRVNELRGWMDELL